MAFRQVLRLPEEKWRETELADSLTRLPKLRAVDAATLADLKREHGALREQCKILGHVRTA